MDSAQCMKRILVFTPWYPTPDQPHIYTYVSQQVKIINEYLNVVPGACEIVVWHQQQALDLAARIFHQKNNRNFDWEDGTVNVLSRQGTILSHRWKARQYKFLHHEFACTYKQVVSLLNGEPDLVWTVTLSGALRWFEFALNTKLKIPFVLQEHSNTIWMHLKSPAAVRLSVKALSKASKVIVVASRQIDQFQSISPDLKPVVVWNAVDPAFIRPCNPLVLNRRILFVGRLSQEKGLNRLLRAISILVKIFPDLELYLVGSGPLKGFLEREADALKISSYVHFLGSKKPSEIAVLLDETAVFVLPSEYENCPVALLEAQTRGVPCIVRKNNASEHVLLPGNGVAVDDQGDGVGIASGLKNVFLQIEQFNRVEIQNRALQQFAPSVFSRKMMSVFSEATQ